VSRSADFPYTARQQRWWFATHGEGAPSDDDIAKLYKATRIPKTGKEAEDWAREHLGVEANYGRVSAESAHKINMALAEAKARGVKMPTRVDIGKMSSGHIAVYSPSNDAIKVDPQWIERGRAKPGYFSTDDEAHTIHHEIGHMVHSRAVGNRFDSIRNATLSPALIKELPSRYAGTNALEFVAETYAGLFVGKTYSETVMRFYDLHGGVRP
jgi:hypothetical protein